MIDLRSRYLWVYVGRSTMSLSHRWYAFVVLLPWPREEQEQGRIVRSLACIQCWFWPRHGVKAPWFEWARYSPNRAKHWLEKLGNPARF